MEPSPEVKDAYVHLLNCFSGGNAAAWIACFSREPGTMLLGNGPDDWFAGPSVIAEMAQTMLPVLQRGGLTFHAGDPQAFREGDIGWVLDRRLTIRTESGNEQEFRATVVLREEDRGWKVVAYTHSAEVPDAETEVFRHLQWE